jgi:cytochrome c-type biogenesis protein CcmH/NrfG
LVRRTSKRFFVPKQPGRGLPPRIYLPIFAVVALLFSSAMAYLIGEGFGVSGTVFGKPSAQTLPQRQGSQASVEGGPPAAVVAKLRTLREAIAAHPNDDVALTELGDMYLSANRFADAIPLYKRALRANPRNVAAQTGLAQAQEGLKEVQ